MKIFFLFNAISYHFVIRYVYQITQNKYLQNA